MLLLSCILKLMLSSPEMRLRTSIHILADPQGSADHMLRNTELNSCSTTSIFLATHQFRLFSKIPKKEENFTMSLALDTY